MEGVMYFSLNENKLSSHMAQISEHINSSNHKINSHDQMRKIIINLGSKKGENNNNSKCQLNRLHNFLLMSIFDTPENDLPNVDRKLDMIKVRTCSVKSS